MGPSIQVERQPDHVGQYCQLKSKFLVTDDEAVAASARLPRSDPVAI